MVTLGAATKVESAADLKAWFAPLRDDEQALQKASSAAKDYTQKNQGATQLIMKVAFK